MKNTYIQDKKYKNYEFSKGEDTTEKDLEVISSRTKRVYVQDAPYENYLKSDDFSSHIFVKFRESDGELFDEENQY